jgi:hypothetical protein
MTELKNRALLVSLSIQSWSARKFDKGETAALARHHGTSTDVARVNKALLPGSDELKAVEKAANAARTVFYTRTLPWMHGGVGILKTSGYMDFTAAMRDAKGDHERAVRQFIQVYPQLKADAKQVMNGLYREEDYPMPQELSSKFRFDVGFSPIPDESDWRIDLEGEELDRLKASVRKSLAETETAAMSEAWRRVHELAEKTYERLTGTNPDGSSVIFRDSLVRNAQELCAVLPSLNLTSDPVLEDARQQLERAFAGVKPDDIRQDADVRASVAADVKDVMSKMAGMYGG